MGSLEQADLAGLDMWGGKSLRMDLRPVDISHVCPASCPGQRLSVAFNQCVQPRLHLFLSLCQRFGLYSHICRAHVCLPLRALASTHVRLLAHTHRHCAPLYVCKPFVCVVSTICYFSAAFLLARPLLRNWAFSPSSCKR